ncbi:hypothetical protein GQ607_009625 [Colletotrichum asianum]|uniref:Major facilitator superfamily (MFS) profile domain-containing protein n=1 Tax=Colletotrichum asianum TaxID=702518 RepID=A0A8H3ZR26_9PEZI|nr:hypothetical protein GQ607_009625 [Colletotrichum asianum]
MFKFINTTDGRPQKRKQAQQACETCRKRKKRCEHLDNAVASPPKTPDSESARGTARPRPARRSSDAISAAVLAAPRPTPAQVRPPPSPTTTDSRDRPRRSVDAQEPPSRHQTVDDDHGQHDDARFVGDLNPEGAFLADSPGTSRGYAESNSVGVWYSRRNVRGNEISTEVAFAISTDHAEHQFLAVLPRSAYYEKLEKIYLRDVHRIFPVLNLDILKKPVSTTSQILCKQAICLAAGSSPSAKPFLSLGEDSTIILTYPEFAQRLSSAIRKAIGLGLVKDRVQTTAILVILSLYTHFSEDRHLSAELAAQAVSNAQTVGLHLQNPPARNDDPAYLTRLFCCVWATDILTAAFHGRPVMIHERDLGRDVQACIPEQDSCFRLFLDIVALLGRIIDLYRPAQKTSSCLVMEDLPSFECLVERAHALRVDSRLLGSLELLYHAIAILSCRVPVGPSPSEHASLAYTRQSLSAIKVTTIVEDFGASLSYMTFVPYAVSLSLRVAYRELRSCKVPMLTVRSRRQLQAICRILRDLGGMFRSALVMVDLAEQVLQEMDQVCSNAANKQDEQVANGTNAANTPRQEGAPDQQGPEAANNAIVSTFPEQQGDLITTFDPSFYEGPAGLDVFEYFDPSFDLNAIDAILGGIQGMAPFIRDYGHQKPDGTYELGTTFLSVTASLIYVGEFCGALITAPINDRWGRKAVFASASACIVAGAIVQVCSSGNYGVFCLGRVLIGLGIGQFTATCLIYISEVAPSQICGPALMMFQFMQSWAQLAVACITQGTSNINNAASYHIPMGYKGHHDKAEKALRKINRGVPNYDATNDLQLINEQVRLEFESTADSTWMSLLSDPIERRKLIFSCGAMFAQQMNGIQFWYTFGVVFAQSIGVAQPFTINTITNVIQTFAVGASVLLGNKIRRRTNLLVCTVGMFVSLIAVGGLGTTNPGGPFSQGVGTAIVVFAYINIVCFNFSIGTLSYTIASEMAVGRNRNKITACAIGVFFFTVWLMVFVSPYLYYTANLGPMLGFVYAGTTLFTLAYMWFCVGETTGRTNADIGRLFLEKVPVRMWDSYIFQNAEAKSDGIVEQVETHEMVQKSMA